MPLTICTDLNADSYDFNNHAYQRFVEKLKVREHLGQNGLPNHTNNCSGCR
jgi:hypothetical protein